MKNQNQCRVLISALHTVRLRSYRRLSRAARLIRARYAVSVKFYGYTLCRPSAIVRATAARRGEATSIWTLFLKYAQCARPVRRMDELILVGWMTLTRPVDPTTRNTWHCGGYPWGKVATQTHSPQFVIIHDLVDVWAASTSATDICRGVSVGDEGTRTPEISYHPRVRCGNVSRCICLCVCLSVCNALTFESFHLKTSFL